MKNALSNVWVKRAVSILTLVYGAFIAFLSYNSIFYDAFVTNSKGFLILVIPVLLVFGAIMIYSRKQAITIVVSMVVVPLFLPILLFAFEEFELIIPLALLIFIMFFACGASEGVKTILGTIYMLLYILGALAYFLILPLFIAQTNDVVTATKISVSGEYRCYSVDIEDSSKGSTKVYVETNTKDIVYKNITFYAKGYKKIVLNKREHDLGIVMDWRQDDAGNEVLYINDELRFRETDAVNGKWFDKRDFDF